MDNFRSHSTELDSPGRRSKRSTHTAADFDFTADGGFVPRFVTCSADGELKIDTPSEQGVTRQFFTGYNPIRVSKIYQAGSADIVVEGWE